MFDGEPKAWHPVEGMIRVGVIGLGTMGRTHLAVYAGRTDVRVVAVADARPERLAGTARVEGNIEGQARGGVEGLEVERYADGAELIGRAEVDLIDICTPTPNHVELAWRALEAGRHVVVEKPVALRSKEVEKLAWLAREKRRIVLPAHCMRFWPGWDWLKTAITDGRYGRVQAATFRRLAAHPGGAFYSDGAACGGALFDLHVHDTDFVHHCFGLPVSVQSTGYRTVTGEPDHVWTRYGFPGKDAPVVMAEGGWTMAPGFPFTMQYTVNFERATAVYDLQAPRPLVVHAGGTTTPVDLPPGTGYDHELAAVLEGVRAGRQPERVDLWEATGTVRLLEAERASIENGGRWVRV